MDKSSGWLMFCQNSAWDLMHDSEHCHDEAAGHQLSIAAAFWIIWIVSVEEYSSFTKNLMQIRSSTHSVILNTMTTQYRHSVNGVYRPHWLVQWSYHYSHLHIPVHSPWLPGYIHVMLTILIILTMVGLSPRRPRIFTATL